MNKIIIAKELLHLAKEIVGIGSHKDIQTLLQKQSDPFDMMFDKLKPFYDRQLNFENIDLKSLNEEQKELSKTSEWLLNNRFSINDESKKSFGHIPYEEIQFDQSCPIIKNGKIIIRIDFFDGGMIFTNCVLNSLEGFPPEIGTLEFKNKQENIRTLEGLKHVTTLCIDKLKNLEMGNHGLPKGFDKEENVSEYVYCEDRFKKGFEWIGAKICN